MYKIELKNLRKSYSNSRKEIFTLKDINLKIETQSFISIVGASASGKSSLLHIIGGLDKPDSGEVLIDGVNIYNLTNDQRSIYRRRNIGYIFQVFNLISLLNVKENILLPLEIDGEDYDKKYFETLISSLSLNNKLDFMPDELSSGEKQRVAIARALITKPSLILADEPIVNLDKRNTTDVMNILKILSKKYGITVLMITHDLEVARLAEKIIKLEDGKLTEE